MAMINECKCCRICENQNLVDVIDLGEQTITSRFPLYGDFSTPNTPIVLSLCEKCTLLQLKYTTNSDELYEHEYGYRSGISNTMREHLEQYQKEVVSILSNASKLEDNDVVVDIGSNDATTLKYYPSNIKRIGVDPTGKQFFDFYGDVELIPTYFTKENFQNKYGPDLKAKVVSSISMFYDLPSPVKLAKDIYDILHDDGIWTCEQSYLLTMLERKSVDTICHEHIEYYSLTAIKHIADKSNFKIIDIKFNECNGGSFRIYFSKKSSALYEECTDLMEKILSNEREYGINNPLLYTKFMENCNNEIKKLKDFINIVNKNNKSVYIYGASTKGNCLLQCANITQADIKYAVERNLNKVGKMTSTGIEIISEETMRENPPEFLLVLPWHFKDEIIKREDDFLERGGQFIFPFPDFEVYSKREKVLVTGCDGMIAKYTMPLYNDACLYGFTREKLAEQKNEKNITKIQFDIRNRGLLEYFLSLIKPNIILHLAGLSDSIYSFENPHEAIETNGIVVTNICDIIHKNNWNTKLFNCSSSEIYKGHVNYDVKEGENDSIFLHCHPYSIGKILGHSTVDFYRNAYNLPFSNGILFTVESKDKGENFLLHKIAAHSKRWHETHEPITISQINSYRCILHASDVAKAIKIITEQQEGNNYVISSLESYSIKELVFKIYENQGIIIEESNNCLIDKTTQNIVARIENNKAIDILSVKITGYPKRLIDLGWNITYKIDDIIENITRN